MSEAGSGGAQPSEAERQSAAQIAEQQRVLASDPDNIEAHAALARLFEAQHDLARAKRHGQAALAADAQNTTARMALAHVLLREGDFAGAETMITPVLDSPRADRHVRAMAWGVIGDARDRRDEIDGAFAAFTESNRLFIEQYGSGTTSFSPVHPGALREMARFAEATEFSGWVRPQGERRAPVFLIGFPRSGTTLLDMILSSHSRITCLEEKDYFFASLADAVKSGSTLARIGALTGAETAVVRKGYWRRVADAGVEADIVVDKMPMDSALLPIIRIIFPDAKILFALRDPRDVVLSCFRQRFYLNAAMKQFLKLETAATLYDAVMTLYLISKARLALDIHEVRYEDVVADAEGEARKLCAFVGLAFEPAMLRHEVNARARVVATPSARQVAEPIYNRSVGRWRRYAKHLAPILPALDRWAREFGYPV
jgi:hypothetical protein